MPESKEVTIYDIARRLKISAATVSRGLQNHPDASPKTRKKVLDMARQMGYRKNIYARNLATRKTNTLGIIVPDLTNPFMFCVVDGIEKVTKNEGYNLLISHSSGHSTREADGARSLFNSRVDGLLASLAPDTQDLSHFDIFFKKNIPVIFFDRIMEHAHCTSILIDNHQAAYEATTHLIDQGCQRIVHITAHSGQNIYADRLAGYQKALSDHNIPFNKKYLLTGDMTMAAGADAALDILKMRNRPDGVFVADDSCAIGCMIALKQKGIRIPADLAFVGFNNDPTAMIVEPNLTTIHYSGREVGETAALYLINHLKGIFSLDETTTILLRHELIIRESSLKQIKK